MGYLYPKNHHHMDWTHGPDLKKWMAFLEEELSLAKRFLWGFLMILMSILAFFSGAVPHGLKIYRGLCQGSWCLSLH